MPHADIWFDGACLGNPGPMGAGVVVQCAGKRRTLAKPLGKGTNNRAEYEAAIAGLSLALALHATSATLHGDSQLILRQLSGQYKVKDASLRTLHAQAKALMAELGEVKLEWVPREENVEADELSKAAAEGRTVA